MMPCPPPEYVVYYAMRKEYHSNIKKQGLHSERNWNSFMQFFIISKKWIAALLACCLLISLCSCGSGQQKVSRSGFYFDTIITITLYGTSNEGYIDQCFELAKEYERKFSNTIETSEISQINQNAGKFVEVSPETIELIKAGISYGELSDGSFDITIGNLSDLWNFSEIAANLESEDNEADASVVPDKDTILKTVTHVDYTTIEIDGNQVRLNDRKSKLDLGGIAKGYIADRMRDYLNEQQVTSGIINLGGNVLTIGPKADGSNYNVGIQKPFAPTGTSIGTISVKDASIVSSGVYERYYRVNDKLYHHILDTSTGYPIENDLYQVTIINNCSMDGDALSTTCFALGLTDGMALVESLDGVEAVFVTNDEAIHCSSGIGDSITFQAE